MMRALTRTSQALMRFIRGPKVYWTRQAPVRFIRRRELIRISQAPVRFIRRGFVSWFIDIIALFMVLIGWHYLDSGGKWGDLAPELMSTAIAIAVLDRLLNYRGEQREMRRVISQMGARDSNDVALAALAVARAEGWMKDGALEGADLRGANLDGAHLMSANLEGATLANAKLEGADLQRSNLQGAMLSSANLQGAMLYSVNLQGAALYSANLQGTDLRSAKLQDAALSGAELQGAHLLYANLEGANLTDANLQDAKYNTRTTWPTDFDPVAAGCILVED